MAQVNITLSEEEIKQIFIGNRDQTLKFLLERILNEVMKAESEEQLGAAMHERTSERTDYRNGTRDRELTTRIGTIKLHVPRHRNEPFHTMVFDHYQRSEASLIATMVQMVIAGVSTRKVSDVVETLCGKSFSKSTVSELCKKIDDDIKKFKEQSLAGLDIPFLMVDATYFKARENHRIVSKAFLVALAIKADGKREVIGFDLYDGENNYSWPDFLGKLKSRGLTSVQMVISDAHKSIRKAIADVYPDAAWQRCQVHLLRNILDVAPPKYKEGLKTELREMFTAKTVEDAREIKNDIVREYADIAEKSMDILENGFEDSMTAMCIPANARIILRTTNTLERLNRELKRRSDVVQVFPDGKSVLRLMGAVALEYSDRENSRERIFSEKNFSMIRNDISKTLSNIAKEQLQLLKTV